MFYYKWLATNLTAYIASSAVILAVVKRLYSRVPREEGAQRFLLWTYTWVVLAVGGAAVIILSTPAAQDNNWAFILFLVPMICTLPLSVITSMFIPLLLFVQLPAVLFFHVFKIDIYIAAVCTSFSAAFLLSGLQCVPAGWALKHGWKESARRTGEIFSKNGVKIAAWAVLAVLLGAAGWVSWRAMHGILEDTYLVKRQEMRYWR